MLRSTAAFSGGATFALGTTSFAVPGTVLRMIGEYLITPTVDLTAGDHAVISVGIGVVSSDAATLGASAVPDPTAEAEFPWLYYASHPIFAEATAGDQDLGAVTVRRSFDVKSMRKLKPRETLIFVADYENINGNPPLTISVGTVRVLIATG